MPDTPLQIDAAALLAALTGNHHVVFANGTSVSVTPAIILDLDGKGLQTLTRTGSNIHYDLDGDGISDRTSWIGTTEGFLYLDRDKSGTFNNLAELSFLADSPGATSNLTALAAFDSNGDHTLSASDATFADFMIWQDKNGNGVVDVGECLTLTAAGVKVINFTATQTATNTSDGVLTIAAGSYQRTSGVTMDLIDGALTFSAVTDGLPKVDVVTQSYDRKARKYRITAKDGQLSVTGKYVSKALDGRAGGLTGGAEISFKNMTMGMLSTIVLDLDGNGVSLAGKGRGQGWFDMNGDGSADEHGWISRTDGFLVIDRNNNGVIDGASELSMLAEDSQAKSSMAALAQLDSNGDKVIDVKDARFGELRVWVDANSNGIADAGELKTLADHNIQSISLSTRNRADSVRPGDNLLISTATYTMTNGMVRTVGDAALAFRPSAPDPVRAAALYTPNAPTLTPVPVVPSMPDLPSMPELPLVPRPVTPGVVPMVEPPIGSAASQLVDAIVTFAVTSATDTILSNRDPFVSGGSMVMIGAHHR